MKEKDAKRTYSIDEKREILMLIDKLGSLSAVEKATGVARATLRRWGDEMGEEMSTYKKYISKAIPISSLSQGIEAQKLCTHAAFLQQAYLVKNEALNKLHELIGKSNNLKDVTGALNVLHAITLTDSPEDPTSNNTRSAYERILGMCPTVTNNVQINHNHNYGKD